MRKNDESANTILYLGRIYHEITQKSSSSRYGVHDGIFHGRMWLQDSRNTNNSSTGRDDNGCGRRDDSSTGRDKSA